MSAQANLSKLSVGQFAERFHAEMIPLSSTFSYFCAAVPLSDEDLKEYLEEPIAALPSAVAALLPKISIMLVPYLEKVNERGKRNGEFVCTEKPPASRLSLSAQVRLEKGKEEVLLFGLRDQEVAEYHYRFYQALSSVLGDRVPATARAKYDALLREELAAKVHGEVDEESWRLKQMLFRRQANERKETKLFRNYTKQSFIDTLTLYLHGICCDIDVETGPRQLPSRRLRKRLNLLSGLFPPPQGLAIFPEQLSRS